MADIRITGRMVNAIRITLDTNDHDAIRQQLSKTLQNASTAGALVVLESSVEQELISLIQLLLRQFLPIRQLRQHLSFAMQLHIMTKFYVRGSAWFKIKAISLLPQALTVARK